MMRIDLSFMFKSDGDSVRTQVSYFYPVSFRWQSGLYTVLLLVGRREVGLAHFLVPFCSLVGKSSENKNAFSCNYNQNTLWKGCLLPKFYIYPKKN